MNKYKYYVYYIDQDWLDGPFTFKMAMKIKEESDLKTTILMLYIDESGKEVK